MYLQMCSDLWSPLSVKGVLASGFTKVPNTNAFETCMEDYCLGAETEATDNDLKVAVCESVAAYVTNQIDAGVYSERPLPKWRESAHCGKYSQSTFR